MSIRSIIIPADPLDAIEVVEFDRNKFATILSETVLGDYEHVRLNDGISLWLNDDGKGLKLLFNQRAQALWVQRYGSNTDVLVGPAVLTGGADESGETHGLTDEQVDAVELSLAYVRVHIENTYEDGHSSEKLILVRPPADLDDSDELEEWWAEEVEPHTGDGHGLDNPKLGSMYEAKVLSGPEQLVGQTYDWG